MLRRRLFSALAVAAAVTACSETRQPLASSPEARFDLTGGQNGTTLTATKTAVGHLERAYHWTIAKSVRPASWNLFNGDRGTSAYAVSVVKDRGTDRYVVRGQVCVTNGGSVPTENLTIVDQVEYKAGSGQFQPLSGASQTLTPAQLDTMATGCYDYEIAFVPVAGAVYRNVAHITITNHSGWLPGGNNCSGPEACPFGPDPKADFTIPGEPDVFVNDSVHVSDSNGQSWLFKASGSQSYYRTFACGADAGTHANVARIQETGDSATAGVSVSCHALEVSKTAATSYTRTYHWNLAKTADQTALTLAQNESFLVNYTVNAAASYTDGDWTVGGTVTVHNPAPFPATLTGVADQLTGAGPVSVECGGFPRTLDAGATLTCAYTAGLPDGVARTNTAMATLQNHAYDADLQAADNGTSAFSGQASVVFGAPSLEVDKCVELTDSVTGRIGTTCYGEGSIFSYAVTIGPYATCGDRTVGNTASYLTNDTRATGSASWTVNVRVPCSGCSLTIGYWKTHAGLGPQHDMLTRWLPVLLGTAGGAKTVTVSSALQAVELLAFSGDAANGINKLYAQLLGAKLNIANGADGSAVSEVIAAADAFLANADGSDWAGLSRGRKNLVLSWATALDNYNNGLTGPGHCSQ